jgi:exoribonuclease R
MESPSYKILIHDREYTKWDIHDVRQYAITDIVAVDPVKSKLFTNDIFNVGEDGTVNVVHSSIRSTPDLPGVLVLAGNKTYGRQAKKNGKLIYKCIPDDIRLPAFLIPYEIKHVGFSKVAVNIFVTFSFSLWNEKHPTGILSQVIGPVDMLENYYEYQLFCKSLNASIQKFQRETTKTVENLASYDSLFQSMEETHPEIENRTSDYVFSIDPPKSLDFDDAFSIRVLDDGTYRLSIYIANVSIIMDVLNLWESFSRRVATIYLPDRKRPMLPTILSEELCSLQAGHRRIAFTLDVFLSSSFEINCIQWENSIVNIANNFTYESPSLLANDKYVLLLSVVQKLSKKYKYMNNVRNSHDVVSYLMIFMNYYSATEMLKYSNGIFRSTIITKTSVIPEHVPEDVSKFIQIWNSSSSGQYIDGATLGSLRHELLGLDSYIHITSPIRRLVDLLNLIVLQQNMGLLRLSENANVFYNKWKCELDYINTTMRSIRRVQIDCDLLHLCTNNAAALAKEYNGYVFDKLVRNDGLFQYIVFLPELKLYSKLTLRENFPDYDLRRFKLFIFNDENSLKKKIRLHVIL